MVLLKHTFAQTSSLSCECTFWGPSYCISKCQNKNNGPNYLAEDLTQTLTNTCLQGADLCAGERVSSLFDLLSNSFSPGAHKKTAWLEMFLRQIKTHRDTHGFSSLVPQLHLSFRTSKVLLPFCRHALTLLIHADPAHSIVESHCSAPFSPVESSWWEFQKERSPVHRVVLFLF